MKSFFLIVVLAILLPGCASMMPPISAPPCPSGYVMLVQKGMETCVPAPQQQVVIAPNPGYAAAAHRGEAVYNIDVQQRNEARIECVASHGHSCPVVTSGYNSYSNYYGTGGSLFGQNGEILAPAPYGYANQSRGRRGEGVVWQRTSY